jgi:hypothetical protein
MLQHSHPPPPCCPPFFAFPHTISLSLALAYFLSFSLSLPLSLPVSLSLSLSRACSIYVTCIYSRRARWRGCRPTAFRKRIFLFIFSFLLNIAPPPSYITPYIYSRRARRDGCGAAAGPPPSAIVPARQSAPWCAACTHTHTHTQILK